MYERCMISVGEILGGSSLQPIICGTKISWAVGTWICIGIILSVLVGIFLIYKIIRGIDNLIDERVQERIDHHEDYCKSHKTK